MKLLLLRKRHKKGVRQRGCYVCILVIDDVSHTNTDGLRFRIVNRETWRFAMGSFLGVGGVDLIFVKCICWLQQYPANFENTSALTTWKCIRSNTFFLVRPRTTAAKSPLTSQVQSRRIAKSRERHPDVGFSMVWLWWWKCL